MKVFKFFIVLVVLIGLFGLISGCANDTTPQPTHKPATPADTADDALAKHKGAIEKSNPDSDVLEKTIFVVHTDDESIAYTYEGGELSEGGAQEEPPEDYELYETITNDNGDQVDVYRPKAIIKIDNVEAKVGEDFTIVISLDNYPLWNWATFEFIINYDPTKMQVNEIVQSEYVADMLFQPNVAYTPTSCKVAAISAEDYSDAAGDLILIHCTALAAGEVEITLSDYLMFQVLIDASGYAESKPIFLKVQTGTVSISE